MKTHHLVRSLAWLTSTACASCGLVACVSSSEPLVSGPISVPPAAIPNYVERVNTGSLFQANAPVVSLFSGQKLPRNVGDTLKIDVSESMSASSKLTTDTSRDSKLAVKGPGQGSNVAGGIWRGLMDLDGSASGSDAYKGQGNTDNANSFNGKIAVSVINVLPNGNLLVAGERAMAFNKGTTTLRFSGLVNPADIKAGNVVASSDVVNARLEALGNGDVSDAASRSWLQRLLAKSFSVW